MFVSFVCLFVCLSFFVKMFNNNKFKDVCEKGKLNMYNKQNETGILLYDVGHCFMTPWNSACFCS